MVDAGGTHQWPQLWPPPWLTPAMLPGNPLAEQGGAGEPLVLAVERAGPRAAGKGLRPPETAACGRP